MVDNDEFLPVLGGIMDVTGRWWAWATMMLVVACVVVACMPAHAAQTGMASWYGPGFHGRRTASGERFNQNAMTCAHRTAKFGTHLKVTDLSTGRSITCRVTDRGPFIKGRIIDLSRGAAAKLGIINRGTARVRVSP